MTKVKWSLVFGLIWAVISSCSTLEPILSGNRVNDPSKLHSPYVVLVSVDGYRFDYTEMYGPPNLQAFKQGGTSAASLVPVYPSKTFTNHYSIATGLYADHHGIVANSFYDPIRKEEYKLADRRNVQDGSWYNGTPLWVAAEQQGLLAANFFWPGSEAEIRGLRPSYYYTYDDKISLNDRVSQVVKWLRLEDARRPHLISVYFADVDAAGHKFGPNSKEVKDSIFRVDSALGRLVQELGALKLPVNVIIVSDHGMEQLDPKKVEYLDDYTDFRDLKVIGDGPQVLVYGTDKQYLERVYRDLKKKGKHFKIFKKDNVPAGLHYSNSPRVGNLIIVADAPFSIGLRKTNFKIPMGNHGFSPDDTKTMHGIFYAQGPLVKRNWQVDSFRNVHIYPFILRLLGIKAPGSIDGDEKVLEPILDKPAGI